MLRQIKMFRLDETSLDEVNQFLEELHNQEAADIDVQIVPNANVTSSGASGSSAAQPHVAVFVVYTPTSAPNRRNIGLGPF